MANSSADSLFKSFLEEAIPSSAPLPQNSEPSPDLVSSFLSGTFDPQEEQDLNQRILEQGPSRALLPPAESTMLARYEESQAEGPIQYGGTFRNAFDAGLDTMAANTSYFTGLLGDLVGNTEMGDRGMKSAEAYRSSAAASLAEIEGPQTFTELMEAPSFGGALTYALSTTGQFAPSAIASITAAMTGAAIAAIITPAAATASAVGGTAALAGAALARGKTKQAITRMIKRAIKNKVKGEKNKATDELLDATWAYMKKVGPKQFWQSGAKHRMVMGGVAGAFSQEFTQGSGILYGDFAEQGMRGPREAGLSLLGGTAYGAIGTAGEAYVVGAVKDTFFTALKNVGSKSYFRNVAAGAGEGLWRGAVGEGAAEFGQEGVSIVQKFNIDDEYTRAMARSDAINAGMAGFIGGGIIGGAGGTVSGALAASVPAISRKSGEYVDKFSRGRVEAFLNEKLDQEELGANLNDLANEEFNSTRESAAAINAQYDTMMDPNTKKEAMWISYGKEGIAPTFTPEIEKDIKEGKLFRVDTPNMGVMLTTREDWANELKELIASNTAKATVYPEDPETGQTDMFMGRSNLDFFLANVLGYSAVRQPNDEYVVEVVDKQGNPVHFQSTSEEGHDAAVAAAKTMFNGKLGKGQDYMFYQDFHNQRNPKDNSFAMRTVETHLIERNNKRKDTLIDQMSTLFEEEALAEKQAEADDSSGLAEDAEVSNAAISYEVNDEAIGRKRYSEIIKGKKAKVPSWAPSAKASTRAGYGKTLERFKNVIRGRDPVLTEQDFNNISLKVAEDMNTAAEKLAKQRGISQKEALSLIEEKVRTPKNWDKEKMVGKGKKELFSDLNPPVGMNEEAELAYNNDPEVTTISEQNLKDMRENHIRTLQKGKKPISLPEARAAAKEAFPDSLVGQPILTVIPKGALDKIIALASDPDFDANTFEIVIAEESTEAEVEDSAGSEFVESDDSIGRIVINVVSEDPSKTLSLVQDKKLVEYALAKSIELGAYQTSQSDPQLHPGIKLDLSNVYSENPDLLVDKPVSGVLETALRNVRGTGQYAYLSVNQLVTAGLNIMKRNGFDPVVEDLNTKDERVRYFMHGFTTILEQLGSLGYDIVAHRGDLGLYTPEVTYNLIKGIEETFPEVVVATTTENPAQLDAFEVNAEENAEKLVSLNEAIEEGGKNLLGITPEQVVELEESNNLEKAIKEKLKTWLGEDKELFRFKIDEAKILLTQIEKRDQILTEMKDYRTGREQIDEAIKNPDVSPAESLTGILSKEVWEFLKNLPFYQPPMERNQFKSDLAWQAYERRRSEGIVDEEQDEKVNKEFQNEYTLGDFIESFNKDAMSRIFRLRKQTKERLAQRFSKKGKEYVTLQTEPKFLKKVYHHLFRTTVPYTFELIQTDKKMVPLLEKRIEQLGFELKEGKNGKKFWSPTEEAMEARQRELVNDTFYEDLSKLYEDAVKEFMPVLKKLQEKEKKSTEQLEKFGEELQKLKEKGILEQDKVRIAQYKTAIQNEKQVLKNYQNQIFTLEKILKDPNELTTVPRTGISFGKFETQTVGYFNIGPKTALGAPNLATETKGVYLTPEEAINKEIQRIKDVRAQYENTGQIIVEEQTAEVLEGKKAEKYIADQKRLRLFKFGKKGTTKKTKTMRTPWVSFFQVSESPSNIPWTWEAEMAEKYWEPVGEVKPDPKHRNKKTLEEKEIKALEKQLKEDGKLVFEKTKTVVHKGKAAKKMIDGFAPFSISDGKLFFKDPELGQIEVTIESEEEAVLVGSQTTLPTYEYTKLGEIDRSYLSREDIKALQDDERYAGKDDDKHMRKGRKYVAKVKYRKDQKAREQRQNIMEWEKAGTLNFDPRVDEKTGEWLGGVEPRTMGYDLPGYTGKKHLPNFSSAFLEQLKTTTKKLGLEKILTEGGQNYMDVLFATIHSSFNIDPKVRTLVISSNEDIINNPAFAGVDKDLMTMITGQQRKIDDSDATLSPEEWKKQMGRSATEIRNYGGNVLASRIRFNGGRENVIILKVGQPKKERSPKLTREGFLFSISKAFGHEIGHIILDSESNWTNEMGVIFKNRPLMLEAYEKAIADPNAPDAWKDPTNGQAEWFADNFSLAMNKKIQPKTGVESMFKRLADMFRKAWENIANHLKARFDVSNEGFELFEQDLNEIIKEHQRIKREEAADPNRWELNSTEAWIVENIKSEIMTWEAVGKQKGANLNKSIIETVLKVIDKKVPVPIAKLFYDADNFLRTKVDKVGLALALMFYGKSQSGEQQGFLQRVSSDKNHMLTALAKILLDDTVDADWGMLLSENPDLLVVENESINTYQMENVPELKTWEEAKKHAEANPEYIYLSGWPLPKQVERPNNMFEVPTTNAKLPKGSVQPSQIRAFFDKMRGRSKAFNYRGFIIVGDPKGVTKEDQFQLKQQLNSIKARRKIPVRSAKKPPKGTTSQDWAWWENRYVSNEGAEKGQLTGRQFKLRQAMEKFYWDNKLNQKGVGFRENYWPRMFDFVEIGANPELRKKLIDLLVKANTENKTRFRRQILFRPGLNANNLFNKIKEGKMNHPSLIGGANKTYMKETLLDENGMPKRGKEGEIVIAYYEFFDMDEEYATHLVDTLAEGPEAAFNDMVNEEDSWIGYELGLGVLPHRAKAFAALNAAVLRKEKLIVDPAIAMDRSISQITKKLNYDAKGGWATAANLLEQIDDEKTYNNALQAVKHLLGKYDQTMSPQFRTFNSWALFMNISSLLAFATFASLPDFAGPIMRSKDFQGIKNVVPVLLSMMANPAEARAFAKDLGVVASEAMELMWIHSPQMDWQTHRAQKASSFFFKYTGLEAFTKFTRYFAAGMGKAFLVHHAKNAKTGKGLSKARSIRYLKELNNIKADVALKWEKAGFNFDALTVEEAREVRLALVRFVDESVVRPSAAERPTWASDPRYALIWQLKSFFYAYGKNILGGVAREARSRKNETGSNLEMMVPLLMSAAMILPLTMLGWDMRERTKYAIAYAIPWQDADWNKIGKTDQMLWRPYMIELVDRSGALGPWTMVRQMYTKAQWGELWVTPLLGPTSEKTEDALRAWMTGANWQWKKNLPLGQLTQSD